MAEELAVSIERGPGFCAGCSRGRAWRERQPQTPQRSHRAPLKSRAALACLCLAALLLPKPVAAQTGSAPATAASGQIQRGWLAWGHEARCIDTMSGERFPFRAEVRLDTETLVGCAYPGASAAD